MIKAKIGYGTMALLLVVALLASLIGVVGTAGTALASPKSLYMVAQHHASTFDAWNILPSGNASYQATYALMHSSPSGIAVDESSATLMVTAEFSAGVEFVNAVNFTSLGVSAGPSNLAGIDTDDENDVVFAVLRNTDDIYVYDWNPVTTSLTLKAGYPKNLPNCSNAFGIAYDSIADILWVADAGAGVARAYTVSANFSTWTETDNFTPSHKPVDIAVDRIRGLVYTVSMTSGATTPGGTGSNLLSKYDLGTSSETTVDMGREGVGVAVDEVTGYVYVTGGYYDFTNIRAATNPDNLQVWNPSASFVLLQETGDLGDPAGICIPRSEVGYAKLNVTKDDDVATCVNPGDFVSYNICYDNAANNLPVHNVSIVDDLPPEVTFDSATGSAVYYAGPRQVVWDIGNLTAGDPGGCETLRVRVNMLVTPGSLITNYATIDSDETEPKTVTEQTLICREEEGPVVGGEVYPVNKLTLLAPWIALVALIIPITTIVVRRRRARS